jgi:hypothetical protein
VNNALLDRIEKAVLYEGYLLYPYRPSAIKNRQRFNFGVLYPQAYSEAQLGTDAWTMQTECLALADESTRCSVRIRFLRMVERSIHELAAPTNERGKIDEGTMSTVSRLEVAGEVYQPWQEAIEADIEVSEFELLALSSQSIQWPFRLSAKRDKKPIRDATGCIYGLVVREQSALAGMIEISSVRLNERTFRLTVRIQNTTRFDEPAQGTREEAMARALVSAHTVLEIARGEFVSMVDPPEELRDFATSCLNIGAWPVLVGTASQRDTILSSPIILYDYPQVAPESPGDLFDGAEIDEILSLRILTMTDEEKREMRQSDERARQILERTETLPEEQWMKLHGAIRGLRPAKSETP